MDQLLGRSQRQAIQRAEAGQHGHRQEPQPQVDHDADDGLRSDRHRAGRRPPAAGRWRRRRWRRARRRRRRIDHADRRRRSRQRRREQLREPRAGRRHPVRGRHHLRGIAVQRLRDRRARRDDPLALLLEDARRHGAADARRRHVAQLRLLHDARQLGGLPRFQDRQGGLAARDRPARSAVLLVECADGDRRPHARRHGQRPRRPGLPEVARPAHRRRASGSCTRRRRTRAIRVSRRGPASTPRATATARRGFPASYDPETKLYIYGTGNPTPSYTHGPRRRRQPVHLVR